MVQCSVRSLGRTNSHLREVETVQRKDCDGSGYRGLLPVNVRVIYQQGGNKETEEDNKAPGKLAKLVLQKKLVDNPAMRLAILHQITFSIT